MRCGLNVSAEKRNKRRVSGATMRDHVPSGTGGSSTGLGAGTGGPELAIDDILLLVNAHFALLKDTVADGDEGERSAAPRLLNNVADHALAARWLTDDERSMKAQMRPSEHAPR